MRGEEHRIYRLYHFLRRTAVNSLRRQHVDTALAMFDVVPIEKGNAKCSGTLNRPKASGEIWTVLERLELVFGVRVVIG